MKDALFTLDVSKWKQQKKIYEENFQFTVLSKMFPYITKSTLNFVNRQIILFFMFAMFFFFFRMKWKYGFVTFERPADAYTAIDTCSKNPAIKDYDISFGGRRAFCREKYLDLGNL